MFSRDMAKHLVSVLEFNHERCTGEVFEDIDLHLYNIVFCH
jgi:hypothetical protein